MGERFEMDEGELRRKARAAVQAGTLPDRNPDRIWGGAGGGGRCVICDRTVRAHELEMELEFSRGNEADPERYSTHQRCFSIWEQERLSPARASNAAPSAGGGADRALPRRVGVVKIEARELGRGYRSGPT